MGNVYSGKKVKKKTIKNGITNSSNIFFTGGVKALEKKDLTARTNRRITPNALENKLTNPATSNEKMRAEGMIPFNFTPLPVYFINK